MKAIQKLIFIILLFLFSTNSIAQKTKGKIVFKDGRTLNGLVKLIGTESVKYRKSKKIKPVNYHFSDIKYVKIKNDIRDDTYVFLKVLNKEHPKVLKEVLVGKVSLYTIVTQGYNPGIASPGMGGMSMGGNFYSIKNSYVKRENESIVTHLGSNQLFTKNFKKATSEFFNDCPILVQKIQNKEYKKRDLKEIISFYNTEYF